MAHRETVGVFPPLQPPGRVCRGSHKLLFVSLVAVLHEAVQFWPFVCVEISLVSFRTLCGFQRPVCSRCLRPLPPSGGLCLETLWLPAAGLFTQSASLPPSGGLRLETLCGFQRPVCSRYLRLPLHLAGCVSRLVCLFQGCCRMGQHTLVLGALSSTFLSLRYQFLKLIIN